MGSGVCCFCIFDLGDQSDLLEGNAGGFGPGNNIAPDRLVVSIFVTADYCHAAPARIQAGAKNCRTLLILLFTALIVGGNWLLYIWAVNNGYLLQGSLGYFINPLVNVVLGMVFLNERLRPAQIVAVLLAAAGVLYLTIHYGEFPWIALALALSFGLYGLIRKIAPVGALVGLTVETLLLSIPALGYLFYLDSHGTGTFLRVSLKLDFLLMGCAIATAMPLLFFTLGARRLNLSTVGLLQYIAPSCMFVLAVFLFREPFSRVQVVTFILIWVALVIYSTDSVRYYKRADQRPTKN